MVCRCVVMEEDYVVDEVLMFEIFNLRAYCSYAWRRDDASVDGSVMFDY